MGYRYRDKQIYFERIIIMKASLPMRVWFAFFGVILWLGIYLTGFSNIHWLLYVPPSGLTFAALTGYCPTQMIIFKLLGSK